MAELKGKGKGPAAAAVASPAASGKKKGEGLGGKGGQQLPHSKQRPAVASVSKPAEVKGKASVSSSARTITKITRKKKKKSATVRVKAVKKVYSLAGQKHDPPEEREPLRIFYESLSKQIPSSEMAEFWMMEHGLLPPEKAKRAYARRQKRQQQLRTGTPVKTSKPVRPQTTKKPQLMSKTADSKARKRVNYSDDDNDDDFIVKHKKAKV